MHCKITDIPFNEFLKNKLIFLLGPPIWVLVPPVWYILVLFFRYSLVSTLGFLSMDGSIFPTIVKV